MSGGLLEMTPVLMLRMAALAGAVLLLLLLMASFMSRARVFCQYLQHMTGIRLSPGQVRRVYRRQGRGGVRDILIDLLIQEDLADPSRVVTPASEPAVERDEVRPGG